MVFTRACSRAWGTLSLGGLLSVLLIARVPKSNIIVIAPVGRIGIFFGIGRLSALLLLLMLRLTIGLRVHFGEIRIVVLVIFATTLTAIGTIVLLLLKDD